jgi:hypothetical protein
MNKTSIPCVLQSSGQARSSGANTQAFNWAALSLRKLDTDDSHSSHTLTSPNETDALVGSGFDTYLAGIDVEGFCDYQFHFIDVGIYFGFFRNHSNVYIDQFTLTKFDVLARFIQK